MVKLKFITDMEGKVIPVDMKSLHYSLSGFVEIQKITIDGTNILVVISVWNILGQTRPDICFPIHYSDNVGRELLHRLFKMVYLPKNYWLSVSVKGRYSNGIWVSIPQSFQI
jgi:hypothetical protein